MPSFGAPTKPGEGQGLGTLQLPDERIFDLVYEHAKAVWHLKDRLNLYGSAIGRSGGFDSYARRSPNLVICSDLANKKKHGGNDNRSGRNPRLGLVKFDTSASGRIELYYDGATREKELVVEIDAPIPFSVDVSESDGTIIGDAKEIIDSGIRHWLPMLYQLKLLSSSDPESASLRGILSAVFGPEGITSAT
jgi:hypothetical protein